jgi:hypothetical protein
MKDSTLIEIEEREAIDAELMQFARRVALVALAIVALAICIAIALFFWL